MFLMFVFLSFCFTSLLGVFGDEVKSVSVMEGDSVTLHNDITDIQSVNVIMWSFKTQESLIATINREANTVSIFDVVLDGRFRDRLQVNDQTGDLIITNITTQHSGVYNITIHSKRTFSDRFNVTVYARLPVPVITTQNSSSSETSSVSKCVLLCSVLNMRDVRDVSLSWYKGNSLLSSISVSDLNNSISLHLECLNDSYSCVVNNPIRSQTHQLYTTDVCQPCSDCVCCCYGPEAVIRFVVSALVGVATVAILIYDIYSNSGGDEQKKRSQRPSDHQ